MEVAGLRFDTGGIRGSGTRWQATGRSTAGSSPATPKACSPGGRTCARASSSSSRTPQPDAALGRVGAAVVVAGAGDVEVRPRHVADEALEERGALDRVGLAASSEFDEVGVAALDLLVVLGVQRHAPHDLARRARRRP